MRREVEEELGISALPLKIDFLFFYFQEVILNGTYIDRQFNDVYITRADISLEGMRINQSEVSKVTFVPFEQFQRMVANGSGELAPVYTNECRDLVYFMSRESGV